MFKSYNSGRGEFATDIDISIVLHVSSQYYYPPYNPNAQAVTGIYREGELSMDMVIDAHR